jgi:AcrR family transcriptional regulator
MGVPRGCTAWSGARSHLLEASVAYVREHGLAGLTLRQLAASIGTSHRMLVYHFGSKDGLLVALVEAIEAEERLRLADVEDRFDDPAHALRAVWAEVSSAEHDGDERLFFELYGQALQGVNPAAGLLPGLVHDWLAGTSGAAQTDMRLMLAVVRGLLLDLLATGERADVDAAFERFVAMVAGDRSEDARQPVDG